MSKLRYFLLTLFGLTAIVLILWLTRPKSLLERERDFVAPSTWHLTGWKLVGGKQLPWELWGQTEPAFRYEKLGASTVWEGAETALVQTPPIPGHEALFVSNVAAGPHNRLQRLLHWGMSERDPATELPLHFKIDSDFKKQQQGELRATYNEPLPSSVRPPTLRDSEALDLAQPLRPLPNQPGVFLGKGIQVDMTVLARDDQGNLQLRLAFQPIMRKGKPTPFSLESPKLAHRWRPLSLEKEIATGSGSGGGAPPPPPESELVIRDERGRRYGAYLVPAPAENPVLEAYLVPIEPQSAASPVPRKLTFTVQVELLWTPALRAYFNPIRLSEVSAFVALTVPSQLPRVITSPALRQELANIRWAAHSPLPAPQPGALPFPNPKANLRVPR